MGEVTWISEILCEPGSDNGLSQEGILFSWKALGTPERVSKYYSLARIFIKVQKVSEDGGGKAQDWIQTELE